MVSHTNCSTPMVHVWKIVQQVTLLLGLWWSVRLTVRSSTCTTIRVQLFLVQIWTCVFLNVPVGWSLTRVQCGVCLDALAAHCLFWWFKTEILIPNVPPTAPLTSSTMQKIYASSAVLQATTPNSSIPTTNALRPAPTPLEIMLLPPVFWAVPLPHTLILPLIYVSIPVPTDHTLKYR